MSKQKFLYKIEKTIKKRKNEDELTQKLNMRFLEENWYKSWTKQRIFFFSGPRGEERLNEKYSNCKAPLRVKSNEEVFEIIQAHEIHSESDWSIIEENKTEFVIIF